MKRAIFVFLFVLTLLPAVGCGSKAADTAPTTAPTTVRTTAALPQVGWITADSLRVRGGAGMQYDIIGGLVQGDRVEITGKSGDWYAIRFGETATGYVSGQYLTFEDPFSAATTAPDGPIAPDDPVAPEK